jgi:hypothetical protein
MAASLADDSLEGLPMADTTTLRCACGQVEIEAAGSPIMTVECCCNSCRTAGLKLKALPGAPPFLAANGNTPYVMMRKDRLRFVAGTENLREYRLTPESKTRRVVAVCCKTPVFCEFEMGHWLSVYATMWPEAARPAIEMRTMTADLPAGVVMPDDVPNPKHHTFAFYRKLMSAWIGMGFRVPKLDVVKGVLAL